jgi:hypothetical protein
MKAIIETNLSKTITNLKSLTSDELLRETEKAVKNERLSTAQVVKLFEEICARKLYLQRGYPSLFEMAVDKVDPVRVHQRVSKRKVALPEQYNPA